MDRLTVLKLCSYEESCPYLLLKEANEFCKDQSYIYPMNSKQIILNSNQSRRRFLEVASLATAGIIIGKNTAAGAPAYIKDLGKPKSFFKGVQLGVITYSFRSMPGSIEQLIQYCKECNIGAVELMGDAVEQFTGAPANQTTKENESEETRQAYTKVLADWRIKVAMTKYEQVNRMFHDAGISIYAFKPRGFSAKNTDAEFDYAFRAAKALGASHITMEFPEDHTQTKRFGEIAARHKIYMGYHGHLQQRYNLWDESLQESKWNAINLDIGHYVAAGFDPVPLINAKHDRIVSMHVKDRKNKANGGENMPWGQGDTPISKVLQMMAKSKYPFPATIELEYEIPAGSDAVKEVAKCVEFAKKALEA